MNFRTAKLNASSPKIVAFTFDTDDADGYVTSDRDITVDRGTGDGVYEITLARGFGAYELIYSNAVLYVEDGTASLAEVVDISDLKGSKTFLVRTTTSGSAADIADGTVNVLLIFNRVGVV